MGVNAKSLLSVIRGAIDRHIKQRSRDTIVDNAASDPVKPLAQRVVEPDACEKCKQLGNSLPVEPSKVASEYHQYCKCQVALLFQDKFAGRGKATFVDTSGLSVEERRLVRELQNAERLGIVRYEKPLTEFLATEEGRRDLFAHAALLRSGRRIVALAENAPEGYSNIDLLVDGILYEVKSPNGAGKRAVESNLRKAKRQFAKAYPEPIKETRVVFNGVFYGLGDEYVAGEIRRRSEIHGISNVIHIGRFGEVI